MMRRFLLLLLLLVSIFSVCVCLYITTLPVLMPVELSVATELLVMSHKCYTPVCNMEGISNVLRSAVAFSQKLASNLQYDVMVSTSTFDGRNTFYLMEFFAPFFVCDVSVRLACLRHLSN